jgi:hypothetical protein
LATNGCQPFSVAVHPIGIYPMAGKAEQKPVSPEIEPSPSDAAASLKALPD